MSAHALERSVTGPAHLPYNTHNFVYTCVRFGAFEAAKIRIDHKQQFICVWKSIALLEEAGSGCLRTGCWWEYLDVRGRKLKEDGENCVIRSTVICTLHQIQYSYRIKEDKIGEHVESTGNEMCVKMLVPKTWRKGQALLGDKIEMDLAEIGLEHVDWTQLAKGTDRRQSAVNTANICFPQKCHFFLAERLSAFQKGLSSMELFLWLVSNDVLFYLFVLSKYFNFSHGNSLMNTLYVHRTQWRLYLAMPVFGWLIQEHTPTLSAHWVHAYACIWRTLHVSDGNVI
jgi:hypothetical protein